MVTSEGFEEAEINKWASLTDTVVSPSNRLLMLDLSTIVNLIVLLIGSLGSVGIALFGSRRLD